MKTFITLMFCVYCMQASCQPTENKFDYKQSKFGSLCNATLKNEEQLPEKRKQVIGEIPLSAQKYFSNKMDSIGQISIPQQKWEQMLELDRQGKVYCHVTYLITGVAVQISFTLSEKTKTMLTDAELYSLYCNLKNYKMDMSKITFIDKPETIEAGTTLFWIINFPLPGKRWD